MYYKVFNTHTTKDIPDGHPHIPRINEVPPHPIHPGSPRTAVQGGHRGAQPHGRRGRTPDAGRVRVHPLHEHLPHLRLGHPVDCRYPSPVERVAVLPHRRGSPLHTTLHPHLDTRKPPHRGFHQHNPRNPNVPRHVRLHRMLRILRLHQARHLALLPRNTPVTYKVYPTGNLLNTPGQFFEKPVHPHAEKRGHPGTPRGVKLCVIIILLLQGQHVATGFPRVSLRSCCTPRIVPYSSLHFRRLLVFHLA